MIGSSFISWHAVSTASARFVKTTMARRIDTVRRHLTAADSPRCAKGVDDADEVVIVSVARTPIGSYNGCEWLSTFLHELNAA